MTYKCLYCQRYPGKSDYVIPEYPTIGMACLIYYHEAELRGSSSLSELISSQVPRQGFTGVVRHAHPIRFEWLSYVATKYVSYLVASGGVLPSAKFAQRAALRAAGQATSGNRMEGLTTSDKKIFTFSCFAAAGGA